MTKAQGKARKPAQKILGNLFSILKAKARKNPQIFICSRFRPDGKAVSQINRKGGYRKGGYRKGGVPQNVFVDARQARRCVRAMCSGFFLYLSVETRHCDTCPNQFIYISDAHQCAPPLCLEAAPYRTAKCGTPLKIIACKWNHCD